MTPEQAPFANAKPGASCSAIPAIDPRDELIAALQDELDAYRRESEYVKQIIELARVWSDYRASREALSMKRSLIELRRENRALKKLLEKP